MSRWVIAITGASGSVYAFRLLKVLAERGDELLVTITEAGLEVIEEELGLKIPLPALAAEKRIKEYLALPVDYPLSYFDVRDLKAPISSGSFLHQGMIIVPCSMGTVSRIAVGASSNLLERAADVTLKERRPLIVVPRETPLSTLHLRNLLTLSELGVAVLPAMPAFYHRPQEISDLVDFVVGRVLDLLRIEHRLYRRWREESDRA